MTDEVWLPVLGYEGAYEVSDHGRVRSIDRVIVQATRWGSSARRRLRGQPLIPWIDEDGYSHVLLSGKRRSVHVLVAEAFLGPRPEGLQTRHIDGDHQNNTPTNLAWGTTSENTLDQVRHGRHHETRRQQCPRNHPLVAPNLIPAQAAVDKRSCLACNRAHSAARRLREKGLAVDFQELADEYYAALHFGRPKRGRR